MLRSPLVVALLVLATTLWVGPPLRADDGVPIDEGAENECLDAVPKLPTDPAGKTLRSDIVVALDGVSRAEAAKLMATAGKAYAPAAIPGLSPNVKLNVIAYHDLTGKLKGTEVSGFVVDEEPQGTDLMSQLIRHYRMKYPNLRRDHVQLFTRKDLTITPVGNAVLGITNCLGSIGTKYSYTITEVTHEKPVDIGPLKFLTDLDAKTVAHEIGHTFGAQHHYATCGYTAPSALRAQRGDVCSLMFNDAEFLDLQFNPVEAAVIRGHAEAQLKH